MPSLPGQHQIEQHQVRLGLAERGKRLVAVRHERRFKAFAAQHDAEHLCQCGVVVDDKDASLHAFIIPLPHRDVLVRDGEHSPATVSLVTGEITPRSVTIAVTSSGGVTSKAGL